MFMGIISGYFTAYYLERQAGVAYILFQVFSVFAMSLLFYDGIIGKKHERLSIPYSLQVIMKAFCVIVGLYLSTFLLSAIAHRIIVSNNLSFYYLNYFAYAPLLLISSFAKRKKALENLARSFVLYNAFTIAPTLSRFISFVLSSEVYGFIFEFFDSFFCLLFVFAVSSFLYVCDSSSFKSKNRTSLLFVFLIETLIALSSFFNDPSFSTTEKLKIKHIVIFAGLYCASLFIYLFHYVRRNSQERTLLMEREAFEKRNQNEICELSISNEREIAAMEERMNKQYRLMADLLAKEDYQSLKAYFADITENAFVPLTFVDCGNSAISCIMNIERMKAKKAKIKLHHNILVPEGDLGIEEYDLCSFFTNIIDNAIEGVGRNSLSPKRDIYVKIRYERPYLISEIRNPTDLRNEDLASSLNKSAKKDAKMHGYGKKIIDSIARKYGGGAIKYSIENGEFVVSSMLLGEK